MINVNDDVYFRRTEHSYRHDIPPFNQKEKQNSGEGFSNCRNEPSDYIPLVCKHSESVLHLRSRLPVSLDVWIISMELMFHVALLKVSHFSVSWNFWSFMKGYQFIDGKMKYFQWLLCQRTIIVSSS
jgi:hypothetical protein